MHNRGGQRLIWQHMPNRQYLAHYHGPHTRASLLSTTTFPFIGTTRVAQRPSECIPSLSAVMIHLCTRGPRTPRNLRSAPAPIQLAWHVLPTHSLRQSHHPTFVLRLDMFHCPHLIQSSADTLCLYIIPYDGVLCPPPLYYYQLFLVAIPFSSRAADRKGAQIQIPHPSAWPLQSPLRWWLSIWVQCDALAFVSAAVARGI